MKILLVHNYYQQRGGEDVVVEDELDLLKARGHEARLHAVHSDSIQGWQAKAAAGALAVYNPGAKARLRAVLASFQPDVVHVHNFFPLLSPSIFDACIDAGIPNVMTLHNFRVLCPTSILFHDGKVEERSLEHSALWAVPRRAYKGSALATLPLAVMVDAHKWAGTWRRKVDVFVALTAFAKAKFVEGGLPAERIVVKPNTVADPGQPTGGAARQGALYVGRLSPEKGIEPLLDAWRGLDVPLRIAGDGPLKNMCEKAQSGSVTYLGRLDRAGVCEQMRRAAFLVLPSTCYEMFPMTLVEAYAHGLPVLASRLGGLQSLVDDGVTGLAFNPSDAADLRAKAQWAAAHPGVVARMGRHARTLYEKRYTAEHEYANLMEIFDRAIRRLADRHLIHTC